MSDQAPKSGCTCYCTTCWAPRAACACDFGPVGEASGSCPEHGWQTGVCDCFFMLTGSHASDCPADRPGE